MEHFDYIIAGGGCAGRSLATRLLPFLKARNKRVLVVDKSTKKENDKTWCFWEDRTDIFEPVVQRKWNRLSFSGLSYDKELSIQPYFYKMIRSGDFYQYTNDLLTNSPQVSIKQGEVQNLYSEDKKAIVTIDGVLYSADYVFSSIPQAQEKDSQRYQYLLQHFNGWVIETTADTFDPSCATLMDFNTSQHAGTSFFYVLPLSPRRALIEYTLFSEEVLPTASYTAALEKYIREQINCDHYTILEKEQGVIPMSDHPIKREDGRIIYLGTAGGFTKGSTGYTFRFIQKHTSAIVEKLYRSGHPRVPPISSFRFPIYDGVLLHLLNSKRLSGVEIFTTMFKKNHPVKILKFLDNETSIFEELLIFNTLQKKEFAMALWKRTLKLMKADSL
ncbi:lycopene cyclase family protein [Pedobacter gandavensis]|nr:lycopene cyclase family protein [Pedobacter gandavensis]